MGILKCRNVMLMKKLLSVVVLVFLFQLTSVCNAKENCNPDPNTLITGVPYCKETKQQTTSTSNPDKIINSVNKQSDTKVNIPFIINFNPYPNNNIQQNPNLPPNTATRQYNTPNNFNNNPNSSNYMNPPNPYNQPYPPANTPYPPTDPYYNNYTDPNYAYNQNPNNYNNPQFNYNQNPNNSLNSQYPPYNQQPYNNQYQLVPNGPQDNLPLQIPDAPQDFLLPPLQY